MGRPKIYLEEIKHATIRIPLSLYKEAKKYGISFQKASLIGIKAIIAIRKLELMEMKEKIKEIEQKGEEIINKVGINVESVSKEELELLKKVLGYLASK